ncbi:MAG: hypothetical protein RSB44_01115 [Carnobacterium sp.]
MYQSYVDKAYYTTVFKGSIPDIDQNKYLNKASRHVDTLTYNRLIGCRLTAFQDDIIKDVVCQLAEFEYENKTVLDSIVTTYAINGISMTFGDSWNVKVMNGVAIPTELYNLLSQTGFTCRSCGL